MTPDSLLPDSLSLPEFAQVWNRRQGRGTPHLHVKILRWLEGCWEQRKRQLLLLVFRGAGKSSLVALFAAWLLVRHPDWRILVLAADQALAVKMVRNIRRIVELHPGAKHLRPVRREQWAADQFTVARSLALRDPSVLARGVTGNFTGSRAELVICDDVEVGRLVDTPEKRESLRDKLAEIEFVLVPDGAQLYAGTPHNYYSLYTAEARPEAGEEAAFLAGFERLEYGVYDAAGASRWPERFTPERIARTLGRSGPAQFAAHMLLSPMRSSEGRLDPDLLTAYKEEIAFDEANRMPVLTIGDKRMVGATAWWDPSFARHGGDASVLAVVFADADGGYWLHRLLYLKVRNRPEEAEAEQQCRQVAAAVKELHLPAVCIETNGLGMFLPGLLRQTFARLGIAARVVAQASRMPKDKRIIDALEARLANRAIRVHDEVVRKTPLLVEMRDWRPGGKTRDDGLDALAGAIRHEPIRFPLTPPRPPRDWRPGAKPQRAKTEFRPV